MLADMKSSVEKTIVCEIKEKCEKLLGFTSRH
jgi:hypothetical protein